MVDILDGFSVGELKVVLLVGRPVLRGGDVGDEPDGELLGVILDGRDVPGWGAATDGRTPRVYPIPVLPSDRRLIVLHVVVGISFGEDLRVVPLDPIHRQIRSCYSQTKLYTFIFNLASQISSQMRKWSLSLSSHLLLALFLMTRETASQVSAEPSRQLASGYQGWSGEMEGVIALSMEWLSMAINLLKRVLVLTTMLFLIENLINFWVLASSYVFLAVQTPEYFKTSISNIYALYNESLLSYIGISIQYPHLTVQNQLYANLPNSDSYKFNFLQFALEPCLLLTLTLLELSLLKWLLNTIKNKARQQREEYLKNAIQLHAQKNQQIKESQKPSRQLDSHRIEEANPDSKQSAGSLLANLFRSKRVANDSEGEARPPGGKNNLIMEITYKILEQNMRRELKDGPRKHWSEDITINKMQKVAALLINYMTGLLLPSFSLFFHNKLVNFPEKINMLMYYLLLGLMLLFPFLYISRNYRRKSCGKRFLLKSSDIETLSQYLLNMCMSVTLGIRTSPIPFLATTFILLSILLLLSFGEGRPALACGSTSCKKVNNILHKLTFWLYNFCFLGMYLIVLIKNKQEDQALASSLDQWAYYCSLVCVGLFALGGCHQLIQFAAKTIATVFKLVYMVYEASNEQTYRHQEEHTQRFGVGAHRATNPNCPDRSGSEQGNISDNIFGNMREQINHSQDLEIAQAIQQHIIVHEVLLEHLREEQSL